MTTKLSGYARFRIGLAFLISVLFLPLSAQAGPLVLSSDETLVCGGGGIFLTVTGSEFGHYLQYQEKHGDGEWENSMSSVTMKTGMGDNMPPDVDYIEYRVVDDNTKEMSNVVRVDRDKSDECSKVCHTTSTGDQFTGTDFNPSCPQPSLPNCVESHFSDYNIKFDKGKIDDYVITNDLLSFFGRTPTLDKNANVEGENYYYTMKNPSNIICNLTFDPYDPKVLGHPYKYHMRLYLQFDPTSTEGDCTSMLSAWRSAKFKANTDFGNQTTDYLVAAVFDDETGEILTYTGDTIVKANTNDVATIYFWDDQDRSKSLLNFDKVKPNTLLRFEITYHGWFPETRNGLEHFTFEPRFEQFYCAKVAVDYISADIASVCVTANPVCLGELSNVKAIGFPFQTNYVWEYWDGSSWQPVKINGVPYTGPNASEFDIRPTSVGKVKYRVYDSNTIGKTQDYKEFTIITKECEPPCADTFKGPDKVCVPNKDSIKFAPYPFTVDSAYVYEWELLDADSNKVTAPHNLFVADSTKSYEVTFFADENLPEGKYLVNSKLYKIVDKAKNVRSVICDTSHAITVYHKPSAAFTVDQGGSGDTICPYSMDVIFKADQVDSRLSYTWTNATPTPTEAYKANVAVPANHCELGTFDATLHTAFTDFDGCSDTKSITFKINKTRPVIDCEALGGDTSFYTKDEYANEYVVDLPVPIVKETCDGDPTVEIRGKGHKANGEEFSFEIIKKKSELEQNPSIKKVTFPVTAGKKENEKGDNGIRVTYVAKDGCGLPSDTCAFMVYIRDTFPDKPNCSQIPNYIDSLSHYPFDQCVATPGQGNPMLLPVLTEPDVENLLKPGTYIHGVMESRSDGKSNLNDPFSVGQTVIRWLFLDDAQNPSYCEQTITVIDDKKPEVKCPDITYFRVHPDKDECTVSANSLIAQIKDQLNKKGFEPPVATDRCENGDTLQPTYYYQQDGDSEWIPFEDATKFNIGVLYNLQWRFYKVGDEFVNKNVYVFCQQSFRVIDTVPPYFDCSSIPDVTTVTAEKGKCKVAISAHLDSIFKPWPYAVEACTKDSIRGEITLPDGSELPDSIATGDTIDVIWTFKDTTLTDSVKICNKKIHANADSEPIFDCSSLGLLVAVADSLECETDLSQILKLQEHPTAQDSCTGKDIKGDPTMVDGSPLPEKLKVGDTLVIKWRFYDPNYSIQEKVCYQKATVIGSSPVKFDCESIAHDTIKIEAEKGTCYAIIDPAKLPDHVGEDYCTGFKVHGVPTRQDGGDPYGEYPIGITTLDWHFYSPYSIDSSKVCPQPLLVQTDLELDAHCGKENFPDITISVTEKCAAPNKDVLDRLTEHFADYPCLADVKVPGVPSRSDGLAMTADFPIDTIEIIWTFTDTTKTLLHPVSECRQVVMISNGYTPPVDCEKSFPNSKVQMDTANCNIEFADIPVYLDSIPVNPCNGDKAVVDTFRASGKGMHEPYELGPETITWTFTYKSTGLQTVCVQHVEVIDTVPPYFDCSTLKDTIVAEMRDSAYKGFPYIQLVDSGLIIPKSVAKCCSTTTTYERSDGLALEDPYPFSVNGVPTEITWIFTNDCSKAYKTCKQYIKIVDLIPPRVECPDLSSHLTCMLDTPKAWTTYDEFVEAGGRVIPEDRAFLNTFSHKDSIIGNDCVASMIRTYTLVAINGSVVSCAKPSVFDVKDDVPPVFHVEGAAHGMEYTTSCAETDTVAPTVTVDDCDPNPTVVFERVSTQGNDPSKCSYYNYDVICTWWATDRCGNSAKPLQFKAHVRDTVPPKVNLPADWDIAHVHPDHKKYCIFTVPDISGLIPDDSIHQDCGDGYVIKWQEPAAGTVIYESIVIKLHISDVCGNDTILTKVLDYQSKDDVVKIVPVPDPVVCADDESKKSPRSALNSLTSELSIRTANGTIWEPEFGDWVEIPSTIQWDYYHGSVSPENLLYSDNALTYAHLFPAIKTSYGASPEEEKAAEEAYIKYLLLLRQTQSGYYSFVAMDTISGCSDTATIYITVNERPRIEIASGPYPLCDGEPLDVHGELAQKFPTCIDDMGSPIIKQGWLLNDSVYVEGTPVTSADGWEQTAVYYATNACGTTTAQHTLFTHCWPPLETTLDSLNLVGNSAEKLRLLKKDSLYTSDSLRVKLYTRYEPSQVLLTTKPQDKARVYKGDAVTLNVTMPYDAAITRWMRIENEFDGENNALFNKYGEIISGGSHEYDDVDLERELFYQVHDTTAGDSSIYVASTVVRNYVVPNVVDTSFYYVLVGNGVCPAVVSNVVKVDIVKEIPTAITPYTRDGLNDDFMLGHHVIIYNRYGQVIFEGDNGWDATYRGVLVDPGVYFYSVDWQGGISKGSIEVVKIE